MLRLTYHGATTIPVEAECITPDNLADKSPAEVAALAVQHGNTAVPLGEFFRVEGDASDGEILLEGDCSRVKWVGAEMTRGRVTVQGNVGMHLGAEMRGGEIVVHGDAGASAAARSELRASSATPARSQASSGTVPEAGCSASRSRSIRLVSRSAPENDLVRTRRPRNSTLFATPTIWKRSSASRMWRSASSRSAPHTISLAIIGS